MSRELGNNVYSVANIKFNYPNRFINAAETILALIIEKKKESKKFRLEYIWIDWSDFRQNIMKFSKPRNALEMRDLRDIRSLWLPYINEELLSKGQKVKCFAGGQGVKIWLGIHAVRKTEEKIVKKAVNFAVNQVGVLEQLESAFPRYDSIPFFKQGLLNMAKVLYADIDLDDSLPKEHKKNLRTVVKKKLKEIGYQEETD